LFFFKLHFAPSFYLGVSLPGHVFCSGRKRKAVLKFITLAFHIRSLTILYVNPKPSATLAYFEDSNNTSSGLEECCFCAKREYG